MKLKILMQFRCFTVNETEMVYSLLREKYPGREILIEFNDNTKEYILELTSGTFKQDPKVPIDVKIKCIYGDSFTRDTPVIVQKNGLVYVKTVEALFDVNTTFEFPGFKMFDQTIRLEKEYCLSDYKVWCDQGWTEIKKIIRHKTNKKIYRVLTHTGCVDVSEDHSLLNSKMEKVTPTQVKVGDTLSHSFVNEFISKSSNITKNKAILYGFFYNYGEIINKEWKITDITFIKNSITNSIKSLLEIEYPNVNFIIDKESNVYKLRCGFKDFVEEYRQLFYNDNYNDDKKIPIEILNSNNNIIQAFIDGYNICNLDKEKFECKGKNTAQCMYYLMKFLGFNIFLSNDKDDIYRLTKIKNVKRDKTQIKKIIDKGICTDYIYDIETEAGYLNCGVGSIQISNTDSIFLNLTYNRDDFEKNRQDTFKLGVICGDTITNDVFKRPPINLAFEKVFQPFILLTKKRYIGNKYEDTKNPMKLKTITKSGIAITRRDYCKMVKKCYTEVIDCIVDVSANQDTCLQQSVEIYKSYIDRIDNYQIDFDDLVLSAMLAKTYKTRPVHVVLAEKLKERNEQVQVGDRLSYIFIENEDTSLKKSELGEDPEYAKINNLKYNRGCYLTQLAKPLLGFFKVVLNKEPELLHDIIDFTNEKCIKYKIDKLKEKDFIQEI
jgi:hypothetical protein